MLFLCLYPNQEVKISMEKLLAVIYDSNQRAVSEWIDKEGDKLICIHALFLFLE